MIIREMVFDDLRDIRSGCLLDIICKITKQKIILLKYSLSISELPAYKQITNNFLINRFMESEKKTQNSDNCERLNGVNLESYTYFRANEKTQHV